MKNQLIKRYIPYGLIILYIIYFHYMTIPSQGDDAVIFGSALENQTLFDFLKIRYETWSSRLIIEAALAYIVINPHWVWCILDGLIMLLLVYSVSEICFSKEEKIWGNWIVTILILIFPFSIMGSTGWASTSMNYLWPLSLGCYSLIPLKKVVLAEKASWIQEVFVIPALLYAANMEQMAAILFGIYSVLGIYCLVKRRIHPVIFINWILILVSLIFILTCPGNSIRLVEEVSKWFPSYEKFSFLFKFGLGFLSTTAPIFESNNNVYLFFSICLFCYIYNNKQEKIFIKILSFIPFIFPVIYKLYYKFLVYQFPDITLYRPNEYVQQIMELSHSEFVVYSFINLCLIALIIFCLYRIFYLDMEKVGLSLLITGAGFCSRIIMGFSPTIFASAERTFTYFYASLIIVTIMILKELTKESDKNKVIFGLFILMCVCYMYLT